MNSLQKIREQIQNCKKCPLYKGTHHAVPGSGSAKAEIFFIGEAPGRFEDLQGEPFVGAAGKFLTLMIEKIGLTRSDVFITSIIKHRPPDNREPKPSEVAACSPYLIEQLKIIKPKIIVLLGRHAMGLFLPGKVISKVHGEPQYAPGIWSKEQLYLPLYHPAAALYNQKMKQTHIDDFMKIPVILKKLKSREV